MRVSVIHFEYTKAFFGAEKLMYLYCQGLKALGHDVRLISLIYPFEKRVDREEQFRVETIPTCIPYFKNLYLLNTVNNLLTKHLLSRMFKKNETIIFTDAVYALPFLQDGHYAENVVVPVYWVGEHPWLGIFAKTVGWKRMKLILDKSKALTAISKAVMGRLLNIYGVPPCKVFLIPEVVDTKRYSPQKRSEILRNMLLNDNDEVAIMATPHSRHDSVLLPKIMRALKEKVKDPYKFILTGKMSSNELKSLINYAKRHDIYSNLIITGYISEKTLPTFYASCDVFLNVGFNRGMTVLEAMASGLPIVSLDSKVSPEWITHGTNGFIVGKRKDKIGTFEDRRDEIAEFLRILVEDSKLREKMSFQSRQIARTKFDYRIIAKKLEKVFFHVLS